jgi:hypothetical protein
MKTAWNVDCCIVCERTLEAAEPALLVIKERRSACMCVKCADAFGARKEAFREIHRWLGSLHGESYQTMCV